MAKKSENIGGKLVTVSIVGLSGTEKEKGQLGVGKSCLCNRFVRTDADDYNVDHISVLSQSDFSGRVVNNDHFLYWGSVHKEQDENEYRFEVVEQTEFVDDACFQPFKAVGKTETYIKRCVATKLQSAEKLMYVCKNQLGIEKEYEQKLMPEGKLSVDGFLCVYDVSLVPGRSWEKQNETLVLILQNIIKLKKPVVLVTSKNDEACEQGVREAERLVQRKEFKGAIPIVETSSHDNVNVDQAFFLLAQMIDKSKARIKVANYSEALRIRRETLDFVTEAFTQLIRIHVQDHKEMWSAVSKRLCHYPEWIKFVQQFGNDGTQVVFRRHIRRLKEERSAKKLRKQLAKLPQVLTRMQLSTDDMQESDWGSVVRQIRSHRHFSVYFTETRPRGSSDSGSDEPPHDATLRVGDRAKYQTLGQSQKIPFEILETNEAAAIFKTYLHEAQEKQRNFEWCQQFKRLLEETGYVTPGKQLSEVRVLLMGRECYEALTEEQQQRVYDDHQREIQRRAKHNLQELLLEHADLFYHFKRISPTGTITQEDIKEITDVLQDDFRYKMLDRMEQDRKLMLFQHLGFVHCPMREHCPAGSNCLDATLPVILNTRVGDDMQESDWGSVVRQIRSHRHFSVYFTETRPRGSSDSGSDEPPHDATLRVGDRAKYQTLGQSQKIPFEILETNEAAAIFKTYLHEAQEKQRNFEWCQQFKRLLEETGYVTPGKQLSEVRVLLMGRECYEALTEEQQQRVYDDHQREIQRRAKHNLQELLLEHADLFYHFKRISPTGTITQEDIKEITDVLQDDFRYKMLDRMEQDRKLMLFQHLGFVHCPMREHCPAGSNCLDATLPVILNTRVGSLTSSSESQCLAGPPAAPWALTSDSDHINVIILGVEGVAGEFGKRLSAGCESERRVSAAVPRRLDLRLRTDDFATDAPSDFAPNGMLYDLLIDSLTSSLHCSYMEASVNELGTEAFTTDAIQELIRANREKASYAHLYRDLIVCFDADIRVMVCMFCDDPYSPERALGPLLQHRACFLTGDRSILIETFLGDSKRKVEVIISSFHGASQFREELIHGFILIYSAKRKASLATLNAFSMNIPNLPIQMVAVTEGGGSASAFFGTDLGHALITDGNATADRLGAHFTTYSCAAENKSAFYTPFFKEVWERKGEIERAFRLEAPHGRSHNPHNLPDVAAARPAPPPRLHSYHLDHKMEHKLTNSLDLLIGPDSRADIDSEYSDTLNNSKNRGFLKGFSVYPPPSTPPEPAPPDHRMHADLSPDLNCSEDSLSTHESDGGGWQPAGYGQRAFTTGRARPHQAHPRLRHSQTLKQPGKLDMNNYTIVSDALQHITIGQPQHRERKSQHSGWSHSGQNHHPSGVSSETELDAQYAQIKETNEYMEAPSMTRLRRHRRHEKTTMHQPSFSETDSSGSSSTSGGARAHVRRRHHAHAPRHYKKRSLGNLVAVQSPRVPKLGMFVGPPELPTGYRARTQEDKGSESSDGSSDNESRRTRPLPPPPHHEPQLKMLAGEYPSSTQDNSSSSAADSRRRQAFGKHDRRHKEFSKSKDKKNSAPLQNTNSIQNWGPQGPHGVPLFVEKCIEFIEREGLASEGLYRVPGNRAHVDMLFSKFYEDPNIDLESLDIPVNAVATALKDFFSKKFPPLLDEASMAQLEDIAAMRGCIAGGVELKDRSWRLLALRALLASALTPHARSTLDYLLHHFARVADNSKLNSMDSKNLAICWWPTLLPVQFSDMGRFEMTRPYLEDIVQTMIDQHPFLFRGQEAFVMV
nr:rho GTPase-activating protein 190 [Danaus plexippus plexippus]